MKIYTFLRVIEVMITRQATFSRVRMKTLYPYLFLIFPLYFKGLDP